MQRNKCKSRQNSFTLGVQNIVSEEKFEYQTTGKTQYKKKCFNDENRIFREVIVNLSENGLPIELNENFTVTWISQQTKYFYDEFGRMTKKLLKQTQTANKKFEIHLSTIIKATLLGSGNTKMKFY